MKKTLIQEMSTWIPHHVMLIDALALLMMAVGVGLVLALWCQQGGYVEDFTKLRQQRLNLIHLQPIKEVQTQLQETA